ncbi:hypothetical protein PCASD_22952 [Puccinia coronata f. sp. avenae]|uniref:Uncharacterized protein n=1 Tax=Puccinia coronata f. sp. avenae TaxID=200324 RepID=A0A2N5U0C3_9BASI|nr:hypothetical protein PCASD_22952 [Puccinia coronata f. sp. avenae]
MKQPTTIDRLLELDVAALMISEIGRLEDSVERLVRSNQEILDYLEEDGSGAESDYALCPKMSHLFHKCANNGLAIQAGVDELGLEYFVEFASLRRRSFLQ